MANPLDNLGAAICGMYAAIKICRHNGIDPHKLCDLIIKEVFADGQSQTKQTTSKSNRTGCGGTNRAGAGRSVQ